MKTSLDSVPPGVKMLINSGKSSLGKLPHTCSLPSEGEFYGVSPREANLELIARFFEKYPSYADKAFLSVKVPSQCRLSPTTTYIYLLRIHRVVQRLIRWNLIPRGQTHNRENAYSQLTILH